MHKFFSGIITSYSFGVSSHFRSHCLIICFHFSFDASHIDDVGAGACAGTAAASPSFVTTLKSGLNVILAILTTRCVVMLMIWFHYF